jgi:hypothetical protein
MNNIPTVLLHPLMKKIQTTIVAKNKNKQEQKIKKRIKRTTWLSLDFLPLFGSKDQKRGERESTGINTLPKEEDSKEGRKGIS